MNERDATEQAFRNGYEAGVREFAERLKEKAYLDGAVSISQELVVDVRDVDELVEVMTVNYESSTNDKQKDEGK